MSTRGSKRANSQDGYSEESDEYQIRRVKKEKASKNIKMEDLQSIS